MSLPRSLRYPSTKKYRTPILCKPLLRKCSISSRCNGCPILGQCHWGLSLAAHIGTVGWVRGRSLRSSALYPPCFRRRRWRRLSSAMARSYRWRRTSSRPLWSRRDCPAKKPARKMLLLLLLRILQVKKVIYFDIRKWHTQKILVNNFDIVCLQNKIFRNLARVKLQ